MLTLRVSCPEKGVTRSLRYNRQQSIGEVLQDIAEKFQAMVMDHGLFQELTVTGLSTRPPRFLEPTKTVGFYDLRNDEEVIFRKKTRPQKVQTLDGNVRTIPVDDSKPVSNIVETMCSRLNIQNWQEFALQKEGEVAWIPLDKTLYEQSIPEKTMLIIKKRFFASDDSLDTSDPIQVHLLYLQIRTAISDGMYPCTRDEAILLAAMAAQVELRDFNAAKHDKKKIGKQLESFLPPKWAKVKRIVDDVLKQYKDLQGVTELQAKYRYIQVARTIKTYGIQLFPIMHQGKEKMFGIQKDTLQLCTLEFEQEKQWPLLSAKRYKAFGKKLTIDFGDSEFSCESPHADEIKQLIAGYIRIILRKRTTIEQPLDENAGTLAELADIVAPFGKIKRKQTMKLIYNPGSLDPDSGLKKVSTTHLPASQIRIEDLGSAYKAAMVLTEELAAAPTPINRQSSLTPQKWRSQLNSAYQAVCISTEEIAKGISTHSASKPVIVGKAQQLMLQAVQLGASAKFATVEAENSGLSLLDASRNLTSSIAGLFDLANTLDDSLTLTSEQQQQFTVVQERYNASVAYMNAVLTGQGVVEASSLALLTQYSKHIPFLSNELLSLANAGLLEENIDEATKSQRVAILEAANNINKWGIATSESLEAMGAAILVPPCKNQILTSCDNLRGSVGKLIALCDGYALGPDDSLRLGAKMLMEAMAGLFSASDCAEPLGNVSGASPETIDTFTEAFGALNTAFSELRKSMGSRTTISGACKGLVSSVSKVVAHGRTLAVGIKDPQARRRMEDAVKAVSDEFNHLLQKAQEIAENPDDDSKKEGFLEVAQKLQVLTSEMASTVGTLTASANLRNAGKLLISNALQLMDQSKSSIPMVAGDLMKQELERASSDLGSSISELVSSIVDSVKDPFSGDLQQRVLVTSQKTCIPAMSSVVAAMKSAPKIKSLPHKQHLLSSSEKTKLAIQGLLKACQILKDLSGQTAAERVTEELATFLNEIDALLAQVQNNQIPKSEDRRAAEDALALLSLSVRNFDAAATAVAECCKTEPKMLQTHFREATSLAAQVINAVKSVVPTLPDSAQQIKLLNTSKHLGNTLRELMNSATVMATRPTESASMAIDKSLSDLKASLAQILTFQTPKESAELEEVISKIKLQTELLKPSIGITVPLQQAVENVNACAKALSAGITQIATMIQSNQSGVASTAQVLVSAVASFVEASNIAAGATKSTATQEEIMRNAKNMLNSSLNAIVVSKKRAGKSGIDRSLLDAVKNVSTALNRLMRVFGTVSNRDVEDAIEIIGQAQNDLDNFAGIVPLAPAPAVREMARICKILNDNTMGCMSKARVNQDAMNSHARAAASDIRQLVDVARAMVAPKESRLPETLSQISQQLTNSIALLISSRDEPVQMVNAAKGIQGATNALLTYAMAAEKTTIEPKLHTLQRRIAELKKATSNLARTAKAAATGSQEGKAALQEVGTVLQKTADKLMSQFAIHSTSGEALPTDKREQIVTSVTTVCSATSQLLGSSLAVSAKPQDKTLGASLNYNGMAVSEAIKNVLQLGRGCIAGTDTAERCCGILRETINDVASAVMAVAVGTITENPPDKPHLALQEELVTQAKELLVSVSDVEGSARLTTGAVANEIELCTKSVRMLCTQAIQAAATTPDTDLQNDLVTNAQKIAETSLQLVQNAFSCACNTTTDLLQAVSVDSQALSQSVGKLVSKLSASSSLVQDLEEARRRVSKALAACSDDTISGESGCSYQQCKDEISGICKGLVASSKSLLTTEKTNLVQIGSTTKVEADMCTSLVTQIKQLVPLAPDPSIAAEIKENSVAVISAVKRQISIGQDMVVDPSNESLVMKMNEAFTCVSSGVAMLLKTLKQGAKGEILIESALEEVGQAIDSLDQAVLFSSAGQLEDTSGKSAADSLTQLREVISQVEESEQSVVGAVGGTEIALGEACKAMSSTSLLLAETTKTCAGQIREMTTQLEMLNTGKAASIALQALATSVKDAQRVHTEQTLTTVEISKQSLHETLDQLLKIAESALSDLSKGTRNLELARANVANLSSRYDTTLGENEEAKPQHIVDDARNIIAAVSTLSSGIASGDQDEISRAAGFLSAAISSLMSGAKGLHSLATNPDSNTQLDMAVKETARHIQSIFSAGSMLITCPESEKTASKANFEQLSGTLLESLKGIEKAIRLFPGGESLQIAEEEKDSTELETIAENELSQCARLIKEAAERLMASRPVVTKKPSGVKLDDADINALITDGAHAIAMAGSNLVENAAQCQAMRAQHVRSGGTKYRADPTWSNGLISAAQKVVRAIQDLITAANKPKPQEEELKPTARAVVAATTLLVTASKVKALDPNSKDQLDLAAAAKTVLQASVDLISTASRELEQNDEETQAPTTGLSRVAQRNREIEMQIKMEKLQEQLRKTRLEIHSHRAGKYAEAKKAVAKKS
ncbi:filopodin [Pelomyxa schiedti]|nr:filopodin [Pelomyxa schiedti]